MTITIAPARNEYTANAGQTIFNYTFKIFEDTDLNVYITPSGQVANDSTDITTSYTVTGLGDEDGGTITLSTGASANDLVTIVSNVPSSRATDYQNNGDFRPPVVNADFDRVVSIAKKVEDVTNRTVVLPQSQQGSKPLSLPAPVAGLGVRWNGEETGLENFDLSTISNEKVGSDKLVINYPNLSAALSDNSVKINQALNIAGFNSKDDTGGAMWDVYDENTFPNDEYHVQHDTLPLQLVLRRQGTVTSPLTGTALSVGCVIRQPNFGDGWDYIDDANHTPFGFSDPVTIDVPNLQINMPLTTPAKKLGGFSITTDEKFAQKLSVGATVGLDKVGLKIYSNMNVLINTDTLDFVVNEFHNPDFISVVKNPDGSVTLDHPNVAINGGANDPRTLNRDGGGSQPGFSLIAQDASTVTFASFSAMTGQIQYNTGTTLFDVFTGALAKPIAVWNGNHLEVSHEDVKSTFHDVNISFKGTSFNYYIDSVSSIGFHVYFFDAVTGAAISSPIATLKFFYTVVGIDVRDEDTTGRCWVNVGQVQCDPAHVFNGSGNFWIQGMYQPDLA